MNGHTVAYYITGYINIISEHIPLNVRFHPHWPYFYRRFWATSHFLTMTRTNSRIPRILPLQHWFQLRQVQLHGWNKKSPRFLSVEVSLFQMVHIFILCPERHSMRAFHGKQCLKSVGLYRPSAVKWVASSFFLGGQLSHMISIWMNWDEYSTNRNPQFWSNLSFVKLWFIS